MFFKAICIILQEYQVALLQGYIDQIKDILKTTFNSEKDITYNKAVNQIVPMCIWKLNENESFVKMNQNIVSLGCKDTEEVESYPCIFSSYVSDSPLSLSKPIFFTDT